MMRLIRFALFATVVASLAVATPRTWYISNGTFDDGGTYSGSFVYDAATNTYSSINLQTAGGTVWYASAFTALDAPFTSNASFLYLLPASGQATYLNGPILYFAFSAPLPDANGTVSPSGGEGLCVTAACDTFSSGRRRSIATGTISTTAPSPPPTVPTLSQWGMFLLAGLLAGAAALQLNRITRGSAAL